MKWYYKLILFFFCFPVGMYFITRDYIKQIKINKVAAEAAAEEAAENATKRKLLVDLVAISGVSDKIARTILDQFPTREYIKLTTEEELIDLPGVGKGLARAIKARIG